MQITSTPLGIRPTLQRKPVFGASSQMNQDQWLLNQINNLQAMLNAGPVQFNMTSLHVDKGVTGIITCSNGSRFEYSSHLGRNRWVVLSDYDDKVSNDKVSLRLLDCGSRMSVNAWDQQRVAWNNSPINPQATQQVRDFFLALEQKLFPQLPPGSQPPSIEKRMQTGKDF